MAQFRGVPKQNRGTLLKKYTCLMCGIVYWRSGQRSEGNIYAPVACSDDCKRKYRNRYDSVRRKNLTIMRKISL